MTMDDASEVHEANQQQADFTFLRQISQGVNVRLSEPLQIPGNEGHANLLAVSNQRGLLFASTNDGFLLHPLKDLRQEFKDAKRDTVPTLKPLRSIATKANADLGERVTFLRIADSEQSIVVGLANGRIAIWSIEALQNSDSASPSFIVQPPSPDLILREVAPNPSDRPELCAVIFAKKDGNANQSGSVAMLNLRSGTWQSEISIPDNVPVTSISWSVKGKQLALGLENGQIAQVTPEGELKSSLPKATDLSGDYYVDNILWLENHVFIVTYNKPQTSEEPEHEYEIYALLRDTSANNKITFVHFADPAPAFGDTSRRGHRYVSWLKAWQPLKHMLFMANTSSTDVGLLGCSAEKTGESAWEVLELEDTSRPALPFSSLDRSTDTSPIGLEVDLTSEEAVDDPQAAARGEDGKGKLSAVPIMLVYTNDGVLLAYHIINTSPSAGTYTHMVSSSQQNKSNDSAMTPSTASEGPKSDTVPQAPAPQTSQPAFGQSSSFGFGQTPGSSQKPSFGQGSGFGQTSAFGSGSFGGSQSGSSTPAFGQSAGASQKPSFGQGSGFGQTSAFGSGSFGGSQSGSSTPSFGQSAQIGAKAPSAFSAFSGSGSASPASGGFGAFASKANTTGFGAGGSSFSFASTDSSKPIKSAFSFAPSESKAEQPTSVFASGQNKDASEQKSAFSFASTSAPKVEQTKTDEQPRQSSLFGSAQSKDASEQKSAFSFGSSFASSLTPESGQTKTDVQSQQPSPFGSTQSKEKTEQKPAFSFASSAAPKAEQTKTDEQPQQPSPFGSTQSKDASEKKPAFSFASSSAPNTEQASQQKSAFGSAHSTDASEKKPAFSFAASSTPKTEQQPQQPSAFASAQSKDAADSKPAFSFASSAAPKSEQNKIEQPSQQTSTFSTAPIENKDATAQKPVFSFASSKPAVPNEGTKEPFKGFSFAPTSTTQKKEEQITKESTTPIASPSSIVPKMDIEAKAKDAGAQKPAFSFASSSAPKTEQPLQQPSPFTISQSKDASAQKPAFSFASSSAPKTEQSVQQSSPFTTAQSKDASTQKPAFSFATSSTPKNEPPSQQAPSFSAASVEKKDATAPKPAFSFASSKPVVPNEGTKEPFKGFSFAPTSTTPKKEEVTKESTTPIASPSPFVPKADNKPKAAVEPVAPAIPIPTQVTKTPKQAPTPISNPPKLSVPAVDTISSNNVGGQGLQEVFLHTYLTMEKELDILKQNVESCAKFQSQIRKSSNELLEAEDLANPGLWTFGELEAKSKIAQSLLKELDAINEGFKGDEFRVKQLRAEQVKTELKQEEIEKFLRAKSDPNFGKMIKVRQLGPEHTENQHKLRRGILDLRQALVEFDGQLEMIRRSIVDARLGKAKPMEVPSIDRINRSVRNITRSAEAKLLELEALELTYESLFSTRSNHEVKELNGLSSLSLGGLDDRSFGFADNSFPSLSNIASHLPTSTIKQDQNTAAYRAYERHKQADKIRDAFLKARKEPVLNTKMRRNNGELKQEKAFEASDLDMVFAKGTVNLDESRQERLTAAREREEAEKEAKVKREAEEAARLKKAADDERVKAESQASEFAKSYASLQKSGPKFEPTPFTAAETKASTKGPSAPALNFAATLPPGALDFSSSASFAPRSMNSGEFAPGQNSIGRTHHNPKSSKRQPAVTLQASQPSETPSTFKADFFAMPASQNSNKSSTDAKPINITTPPLQPQNDPKANAKAFGFGAWSPPTQPRNEVKNGFSFGMNNSNPSFSSFSNAAAASSTATTFKGLQDLQPISSDKNKSSSSGASVSTQPFSFARQTGRLSMDDVDGDEEDEEEEDEEEEEEEEEEDGEDDEYEDDDDDPNYSDVDEDDDEEEGLSAVSEGDEEEE